jgi:uncharacterized protein YndB with AHSA1/START domain
MLTGKNVDVVVTLPAEREIAFSCRLHHSARLLFEAWTKPEQLRCWWGCEGSTITHCAIDLRVGGAWSLVMQMSDGSDHSFRGVYREIVPWQRLVYTECYEMPQFGNPEWLTNVTFHEAAGVTLVTHAILHKSREVRDRHLQAGMQAGMIQTFHRLDEYVSAAKQD